MKFLKFFSFLLVVAPLFSCSSDDDICTSGEATPRIKIKFKTLATGKLKTLDSVFVSVDYAAGNTVVINKQLKVDSLLIPLRVDDSPFTDIHVKLAGDGPESKIRINYNTTSEYVSPACGIKKLYENVSSQLETQDPVFGLENAQNQILNEDKTHLFLLF